MGPWRSIRHRLERPCARRLGRVAARTSAARGRRARARATRPRTSASRTASCAKRSGLLASRIPREPESSPAEPSPPATRRSALEAFAVARVRTPRARGDGRGGHLRPVRPRQLEHEAALRGRQAAPEPVGREAHRARGERGTGASSDASRRKSSPEPKAGEPRERADSRARRRHAAQATLRRRDRRPSRPRRGRPMSAETAIPDNPFTDDAHETDASSLSRAIQEHLDLKKRNAELDGEMPIDRYSVEDPFENHPLFKSEEQARLEETLDGVRGAGVVVGRAAVARRGRRAARASRSPRRAPPSTTTSGAARATSTGASSPATLRPRSARIRDDDAGRAPRALRRAERSRRRERPARPGGRPHLPGRARADRACDRARGARGRRPSRAPATSQTCTSAAPRSSSGPEEVLGKSPGYILDWMRSWRETQPGRSSS